MKSKTALLFQLLLAFSILFASANSFTIAENNKYFVQKSFSNLKSKNRDFISKTNQLKTEKNKQAQLSAINHPLGSVGLQNTTIYDNYLKGNMLILGDYVLMPQSIKGFHPTIKRLHLSTMKFDTIEYTEEEQYLDQYELSTIADFQNGDIGYGRGEVIYILDKATLKIKQKIPAKNNNYLLFSVIKFHVFNDQESGKSRILVERGQITTIGSFWELKKINSSNLYRDSFAFYFNYMVIFQEVNFNFYLTEENKAVLTRSYELRKWQNLNDGIIYSEDSKYILKQRTKIAVSYSETFFVVRHDSTYEVYDFDQKYQLTLKLSIPTLFNYTQKGELTSDDKFLFLVMSNNRSNITFAKVNLADGQITYFNNLEKGVKIIDFHLFASQTDQIVLLVQQGSKYSLQLRAISNLAVIHQIQLTFSFIPISLKLLGTIEWGHIFGLAVRYTPYPTPQNNSYLYQYKIEGDAISFTQIMPTVNMETIKACYKYLADYDVDRSNKLNMYHFSNFTLATIIQTDYFETIAVQKNIMIAVQSKMTMFNLSSSFEPIGIFYLGSTQTYYIIRLILSNRGLIVLVEDRYFTTAAIYNISNPQVKRVQRYEYYPTAQYSIYFQVRPKSQCNKIYYVDYLQQQEQAIDYGWQWVNPKIIEYDECSGIKKKHLIDYRYIYMNQVKILVSSDEKYLILVIPQYEDRPFPILIQVRERENLGNIIFRQEFIFGQLYKYYQTIRYLSADVLNNSQLLITSVNFVFLTIINAKDKSSILQQEK